MYGTTSLWPSSHACAVLFYQVIYPLKEIYPDSGELGLLGHILPPKLSLLCLTGPRQCLLAEALARLLVSRGFSSPPSSVYCLGVCTLTSSSVFPSLRRDTHRRKGRYYFFAWPFPCLLRA